MLFGFSISFSGRVNLFSFPKKLNAWIPAPDLPTVCPVPLWADISSWRPRLRGLGPPGQLDTTQNLQHLYHLPLLLTIPPQEWRKGQRSPFEFLLTWLITGWKTWFWGQGWRMVLLVGGSQQSVRTVSLPSPHQCPGYSTWGWHQNSSQLIWA